MDPNEVARREEARLQRSFLKKKSFSMTPSFLSRRNSMTNKTNAPAPAPRQPSRSFSLSPEDRDRILREKKLEAEKREKEREEFEQKEREMAKKRMEMRKSRPEEKKEEDLSVLLRDATTKERVRIARMFGKTNSLPVVNFRNQIDQKKLQERIKKEDEEKKKAKEEERVRKEEEEKKKKEEEKRKEDEEKRRVEEEKVRKEEEEKKKKEEEKRKEDEEKVRKEEEEKKKKEEEKRKEDEEKVRKEEEVKNEKVENEREEKKSEKELKVTINYNCQFGQHISLVTSSLPSPVALTWHEGHNWKGSIMLDNHLEKLSYYYAVIDDEGNVHRKEDGHHEISLEPSHVSVVDQWN